MVVQRFTTWHRDVITSGMRWIIGDVHGMLAPLEALIDAVDETDPDAELLFAGDYVNRGPDSRGVLELLSDIDGARFIRGNHDDIFDLVVNGACFAPHPSYADPATAFAAFQQFGLDRTLVSYGVDPDDIGRVAARPTPDSIATLCSVVPEHHRRFIRELPVLIDEPDLFVAHGYWSPGATIDAPSILDRLALEPRLRVQLLWSRYDPGQVMQPKPWTKHGFFGHTPVDGYPEWLRGGGLLPVVGPQITLLDTACALIHGGRLTAVCHEARMMLQVDRRGNLVG